jgi:hypothetical protein
MANIINLILTHVQRIRDKLTTGAGCVVVNVSSLMKNSKITWGHKGSVPGCLSEFNQPPNFRDARAESRHSRHGGEPDLPIDGPPLA